MYEKELLDKYEREVRAMAYRTSDRKFYKEIVSVLERMQKYKEGKPFQPSAGSLPNLTQKVNNDINGTDEPLKNVSKMAQDFKKESYGCKDVVFYFKVLKISCLSLQI